MKEELNNKSVFINRLSDLLRTDPRSDIYILLYEAITFDGCTDENIHVCYTDVHFADIIVTGKSIGAIAKAVINEVYK